MLRNAVGTLGAWFIYALIWLFGRKYQRASIPWLVGPLGGPVIGDRAYEETAAAEGLTLVRGAQRGGLIPDFDALRSPSFDPARVHPAIRDFYENTWRYRLDTWASTYFPASVGLWLLVTTISRRVQQLNFPLDGLDVAHGMTSEIILLTEPSGKIRYTGWFRKLTRSKQVIYTGFYLTEQLPEKRGACVKVVFPMPNGNATVLLKPENDESSGLKLISAGQRFGDTGFYRMQRAGDALRVWRIRSLHETFALYVDNAAGVNRPGDSEPGNIEQDNSDPGEAPGGAPLAGGSVRCEHDIRFLGLRVLTLHYRISKA